MIHYVVFDVFETLVTLHNSSFPYFGKEMAADMGVPWDLLRDPWRATDPDRTLGKVTVETVIKDLMMEFACFSEDKYAAIVKKRYESKQHSFDKMREDILPMLAELKRQGCSIGILSNCYFEEQAYIRKSKLMPYLDTAVLSCQVGMAKPEEEIFALCMKNLWQGSGPVDPKQYLYIGDGGSYELETASRLGMTACQAMWYSGEEEPIVRKPAFPAFYRPSEVTEYVTQNKAEA